VSEPTSSELPIRPAATIIALRDGPDGLEVLLMQRAQELAFHGGAWAFPGGRVDPADQVEAAGVESAGPSRFLDYPSPIQSARHAAIREAREEASVVLAPEELVPFAHWTTPRGAVRRFATWFFLYAAAPDLRVVPDGKEMRAFRWLSPRQALADKARGRMDLPAPTFVSLSQLAAFADHRSALAHATGSTPLIFQPRPSKVPGGIISLYAGDAGYEAGNPDTSGARHRLCMLESGWRYERDTP
jgi:8-oxo-dGTP pyrophosphatase MutT (NUDIX family)